MTAHDMISNLQAQIDALSATSGEFTVHGFDVWSANEHMPTVRVQRNTWSWGSCTSETCNHNSHDPYAEGVTQFVLCRPVGVPGIDEDDNHRTLYEMPCGQVIEFVQGCDNGHYSPAAHLCYADPATQRTPIPVRESALSRW